MATYEASELRYFTELESFRAETVKMVRVCADTLCVYYGGAAITVSYDEYEGYVNTMMAVGHRPPASVHDGLDTAPQVVCEAARMLDEALMLYAATCVLSRGPRAERITFIDPHGQVR